MKKALIPNKTKSFTLIELMIVIAILGALSSMIFGQFMTSIKKGRDARRKSDLSEIQKAIEMYYEDNQAYPTPPFSFGSSFGTTAKTYMQKTPNDPITANDYGYDSDGTYFRFFSCIENENDQASGVSQGGFNGAPNCGTGVCETCKYTISSPNITPLPTIAP